MQVTSKELEDCPHVHCRMSVAADKDVPVVVGMTVEELDCLIVGAEAWAYAVNNAGVTADAQRESGRSERMHKRRLAARVADDLKAIRTAL